MDGHVLLSLPLVYADLLLGLFFDPEDGGGMFVKNIRQSHICLA
jgi:hypothetical protein